MFSHQQQQQQQPLPPPPQFFPHPGAPMRYQHFEWSQMPNPQVYSAFSNHPQEQSQARLYTLGRMRQQAQQGPSMSGNEDEDRRRPPRNAQPEDEKEDKPEQTRYQRLTDSLEFFAPQKQTQQEQQQESESKAKKSVLESVIYAKRCALSEYAGAGVLGASFCSQQQQQQQQSAVTASGSALTLSSSMSALALTRSSGDIDSSQNGRIASGTATSAAQGGQCYGCGMGFSVQLLGALGTVAERSDAARENLVMHGAVKRIICGCVRSGAKSVREKATDTIAKFVLESKSASDELISLVAERFDMVFKSVHSFAYLGDMITSDLTLLTDVMISTTNEILSFVNENLAKKEDGKGDIDKSKQRLKNMMTLWLERADFFLDKVLFYSLNSIENPPQCIYEEIVSPCILAIKDLTKSLFELNDLETSLTIVRRTYVDNDSDDDDDDDDESDDDDDDDDDDDECDDMGCATLFMRPFFGDIFVAKPKESYSMAYDIMKEAVGNRSPKLDFFIRERGISSFLLCPTSATLRATSFTLLAYLCSDIVSTPAVVETVVKSFVSLLKGGGSGDNIENDDDDDDGDATMMESGEIEDGVEEEEEKRRCLSYVLPEAALEPLFLSILRIVGDASHDKLVSESKLFDATMAFIKAEVERLGRLERATAGRRHGMTQGLSAAYAAEIVAALAREHAALQGALLSTCGGLADAVVCAVALNTLTWQKSRYTDRAAAVLLGAVEACAKKGGGDSDNYAKTCVEALVRVARQRQPLRVAFTILQALGDEVLVSEGESIMMKLVPTPEISDIAGIDKVIKKLEGKVFTPDKIGCTGKIKDVAEFLETQMKDKTLTWEILVCNKIIDEQLTIRDVYEQIWLPAHPAPSDGKSAKPMEVVYHIRGLGGEAKEDIVNSLPINPKNDPAYIARIAGIIHSSGALETISAFYHRALHAGLTNNPALTVALSILSLCARDPATVRPLLEANVMAPAIKTIRAALALLLPNVSNSASDKKGGDEAKKKKKKEGEEKGKSISASDRASLLKVLESVFLIIKPITTFACTTPDIMAPLVINTTATTPSSMEVEGDDDDDDDNGDDCAEDRSKDKDDGNANDAAKTLAELRDDLGFIINAIVPLYEMFKSDITQRVADKDERSKEIQLVVEGDITSLCRTVDFISYLHPSLSEPIADYLAAAFDLGKCADRAYEEDISFVLFKEIIRDGSEFLKSFLVQRGFVALYLDKVLAAFPAEAMAETKKGLDIPPGWEQSLDKPPINASIDTLYALSHKSRVIQDAIFESGAIPIFHKICKLPVTNAGKTALLSEDLLKSIDMSEKARDALAALRDHDNKIKAKAIARRQKALADGIGNNSKKKKKTTKKKEEGSSSKIAAMLAAAEDEGKEETGLKCVICQEGYTLAPANLLGVYALTRKAPSSTLGLTVARKRGVASGPCTAVTTSTFFHTIHCECHVKAIEAEKYKDARDRKTEWDAAQTRNQMARCNTVFPIIGTAVPEAAAEKAIKSYWRAAHPEGGGKGPGFLPLAQDLQLALLHVAYSSRDIYVPLSEIAKSSESSGTDDGGKESNLALAPFMVQLAHYAAMHGNEQSDYAEAKAALDHFLGIGDINEIYDAQSGPRNTLFFLTLSLFCLPYSQWKSARERFLVPLAAYSAYEDLACRGKDGRAEVVDAIKPAFAFFVLVDALHEALHKFLPDKDYAGCMGEVVASVAEKTKEVSEAAGAGVLSVYGEKTAKMTSVQDILTQAGFAIPQQGAEAFWDDIWGKLCSLSK